MLDLTDLPDDPVHRLVALLQLEEQLQAELEAAYAETYFDARIAGLLPSAFTIGRHPKKIILRMTRQENDRRGRQVHWADGADRTSTGFQSPSTPSRTQPRE